MIEGVKIKELTTHEDDRGSLTEILRSDDEMFKGFGQAYMCSVNPGVFKGWHFHTFQTDTFVAMRGYAVLVLFDSREDSPTFRESFRIRLSGNMYQKPKELVQIPPGIHHGFYSYLDKQPATIVNFPDKLYNREHPDEIRLPWDALDFDFPPHITSGG